MVAVSWNLKAPKPIPFPTHLGFAHSAGIPASQPFLISAGFASCRGVARKGHRAPIHTIDFFESSQTGFG